MIFVKTQEMNFIMNPKNFKSFLCSDHLKMFRSFENDDHNEKDFEFDFDSVQVPKVLTYKKKVQYDRIKIIFLP